MDLFKFHKHCGIVAALNCSSCGLPMDNQLRKPITGICGHTICTPCLYKMFNPYNGAKSTPGRFELCPMIACRREGFQFTTTPSSSVMIAISKFQEMEEAVHSFMVKHFEYWKVYDKEKLLSQVRDKEKALQEKQNEITELTSNLSQAQRRIQELVENEQFYEVRIAGMRDYIQSLQQRLSMDNDRQDNLSQSLRTVNAQAGHLFDNVSEASLLSPGLSGQIDHLKEVLRAQRKRTEPTTDSSLSSLEIKPKNQKYTKYRKVSLEPNHSKSCHPRTRTGVAAARTDTGVAAGAAGTETREDSSSDDDSDSSITHSSDSTPENEFI